MEEIRNGKIKTHPNVHIKSETNTTAVVNGDAGFGHLTLKTATDLAIKMARSLGAAWVGINHGNLAGPGAIWVWEMLGHDMIGIYGAVGGNNLVPPWGGRNACWGILNGAAMGRDVPQQISNIGQFIAAISIELFGDVENFKRNVDTVARDMRGSEKLPGVEEVRVPGDAAEAKRQDRLNNGILIAEGLFEGLNEVAVDLRLEGLG